MLMNMRSGMDINMPARMLNEFVYGIPELHREEMKKASYISSAGCNATANIWFVSAL